jgi:hypothetical protein
MDRLGRLEAARLDCTRPAGQHRVRLQAACAWAACAWAARLLATPLGSGLIAREAVSARSPDCSMAWVPGVACGTSRPARSPSIDR